MSRPDNGSFTHPTSPSSSCLASKAHSMNQDTIPQTTSITALNVLFLGETNIGESSIIDLIAGPSKQKEARRQIGCRDDARSIALDGKMFILHALSTHDSMASTTLQEGIQNALADICRNGGVHLVVYCMDALHSTKWTYEIHRIIFHSTPSLRIPAIAVVTGISNKREQQSWWSSNEDAFAKHGLRFDDHTFIRTINRVAQSTTGDHISESRHLLRTLIFRNCAYALSSETDSDLQRTTPYEQQALGNSFHPLFVTLGGKPPSCTSTNLKTIDIVLLGEIGVGKSSLINLIARDNVAEVSPDTIACTRTPVKYTFEEKGRTFHLFDTPGLVDPQMGVEPFINPIDTIQRLIRGLGDGNGPDLLLFCIDNSKPTAALQRNYRLFSKLICGDRVSFALAITKLEEGQDASEWWNQYGAVIRRYGIDSAGHFGVGREKRHLGPDANLELRESFLAFLVECTDRQKNKISSLRSSMGRVISVTSKLLRARAQTPERTLMSQCGLEEQVARELAKRMGFHQGFKLQ